MRGPLTQISRQFHYLINKNTNIICFDLFWPGAKIGGGFLLEKIGPVRPVIIELGAATSGQKQQRRDDETHAGANLDSLHASCRRYRLRSLPFTSLRTLDEKCEIKTTVEYLARRARRTFESRIFALFPGAVPRKFLELSVERNIDLLYKHVHMQSL